MAKQLPDAKIRIRAEDKTKKGIKSAKSGFKDLAIAAAKMGVALAVVGGGLAVLIKRSLDAGDRIQKLAISTGIATETLSELRHVAQITGVDFEAFPKAISKLQKATADASDGLKTYVDLFNKAGINVEKFKNLNADEQFMAMGEALSRMNNQSDKTQVAMGLMGRGGVDLIRVFDGGAESVSKLREEAKKLGLSLSREQVDSMADANDAMTRMATAGTALGNTLAVNLAPAIIDVATAFQENLPKAMEFSRAGLKIFTAGLSKFYSMLQRIFEFQASLPKWLTQNQELYKEMAVSLANVSQEYSDFSNAIIVAGGASKSLGRTLGESMDVFNTDYTPSLKRAAKTLKAVSAATEATEVKVSGLDAAFADLQTSIRGWGDEFANTLLSAEASFASFVKSVIRQMAKIAIVQAMTPLFEMFGKSIAGAFSGAGTTGGFSATSLSGTSIRAAAAGTISSPNILATQYPGMAGFAEGTDYIPKDGFAMLHKGEAVVPAKDNVFAMLHKGEAKDNIRSKSDVVVNVINNSQNQVGVKDRGSVNGKQQIEILVMSALNGLQQKGALNPFFRENFGLSPRTVNRG